MPGGFIFQPVSLWYEALPPLPSHERTTPLVPPDQLSAKAAQLHHNDVLAFQSSSSKNSSSSEANFLSKIIQSGTLSDRLSALTLLVQSSPLHNIRALETLKGMAERGKGKGGREESLKALRCIVDWWVGGGAPDRKLKYFRDQPLLHADVDDVYLIVWHFEDWLKKFFFSILQILESLSLDPLPYIRTQTLSLILTLLRDRPEQEQNLLRLLVNKLGDTEKSLCSRASYHLLQLLQAHPSMKAIVVREIITLVLKPSASAQTGSTGLPKQNKHIKFTDGQSDKKSGNPHAKYYAMVTFNQIVLTPADRDVAITLLDVYFEMFKELLGEEKEDVKESTETGDVENLKTDKKGRVLDAGRGKGKKGKGKTKTTENGAAGFAEVEDSDSKLISAILTGVNRALPFAKISAEDVGINKHIDTLFFITHTSTFNISLQALMLIQQITVSLTSPSVKSNTASSTVTKSITDRYYRALYASLHDNRLPSSSKQAMYLNLFFKSIKADAASSAGNGKNDRIKALIRRFTQVLVSGGGGATEFVAGGLYLLGELFSSIPGLRTMVNHPQANVLSDEERYDPRKRDPQYAHAETSPLWELIPLLQHYHPAISLHARQLLSSQPLTASPDLSQNTLSHFLDRFVYKNPKKLKSKEDDADHAGAGRLGKGASAMQPAASGVEGVKLIKGEIGYVGGELMNEKAFLRKQRTSVPIDQVFFYDYFTRKHEKEKALAAKARKKGKDVDEDDDEDDEAVEKSGDDWEDEDGDGDAKEEEIWKTMKASMPKVDGEGEDLIDGDNLDGDDEIIFDDDSETEPLDDQQDQGVEHGDLDDSDADMSLAEASDDDDLVPLDGLIEFDGSDASDAFEEGEWIGIENRNGKRKREETGKAAHRKKLRSLPTFASYDEYAKMIEEEPEDNI